MDENYRIVDYDLGAKDVFAHFKIFLFGRTHLLFIHQLHLLVEDILAVPSIPTESVARDAVDCFLELFEQEGISLQPEIPTTGTTPHIRY